MMNRIAAATVIRGAGECQVYMDSVVSDEVKRINEQNARERDALRERIKATEAHRDKLLAQRLKEIDSRSRRSPIRRTARRCIDKIQVVWAMIWWINHALGQKIIRAGLKLGLWEEVE